MKTIGIVGSEAAKFTKETEAIARDWIRRLIVPFDAVVSGECHLGGIDIWAKEEALAMGKKFIPCEPEVLQWNPVGKKGYMARNIDIAIEGDMVVCITLKKLPDSYKGMKFDKCYHCDDPDHVKSGGCWTTKYARKLHKRGFTLVIGE